MAQTVRLASGVEIEVDRIDGDVVVRSTMLNEYLTPEDAVQVSAALLRQAVKARIGAKSDASF